MRIDIAQTLKIGQVVNDCFLTPLTVFKKQEFYSDKGSVYRINLTVTDSMNNIHIYDCDNLYLPDLEDESDEEKSWITWATNNKDFFETFDHIDKIKEVYKTGFADGFEYKKLMSYQEMMQK